MTGRVWRWFMYELSGTLDWAGHALHVPGRVQFRLCQWVGREEMRRDP